MRAEPSGAMADESKRTPEARFPKITEEVVDRIFNEGYVQTLALTPEDFAEGKSICAIGAGENGFVAGVKRAYPNGKHAFVMGVDPSRDRYHTLDPAIINHDARELGFPSDFEGFDLVVAHDSVPKYFMVWGQEEERKAMIADGQDVFDYSIADRSGTREEIVEAVYTAFSEMLRITKPGGKVKVWPVIKSIDPSSPEPDQEVLEVVTQRLKEDYPGLETSYFDNSRPQTSFQEMYFPAAPFRPYGFLMQKPSVEQASSEEEPTP